MKRVIHHDRNHITQHMKRYVSTNMAQRQTQELAYVQSPGLVTPCRLFLVFIGSMLMVLLLSLSTENDLITSSDNLAEIHVNLTKEPYNMNFQDVLKTREEMMSRYGYSGVNNKVEKRATLSLQEFWDLYDGKWPVIITDVVPSWTAYKSWGKNFFLENYATDRIILKAVEGVLNEGVAHIRDLKSFISLLELPASPHSWTYMEDEMFLMLRPELKLDIGYNYLMEENFFTLFPNEVRPWDSMMLWGTKYSRSKLHMDPYNWTAVSAVIWGRKKWK